MYDVAVPDAKYSCCSYPAGAKSTFVAEARNTPLPPVTSLDISATGPDGRARVVVGGAELADPALLLSLEQPATDNSIADTTAAMTVRPTATLGLRRGGFGSSMAVPRLTTVSNLGIGPPRVQLIAADRTSL